MLVFDSRLASLPSFLWQRYVVWSIKNGYVLANFQLLGDATEQMSVKLGSTLAGLLNATFGNAVEIIVGIAALLQGFLKASKHGRRPNLLCR